MSAFAIDREPVFVAIDAPGTLYDSIILNGQVIPMVPSTTAAISVRPLMSRTAVVTEVASTIYPTDSNGSNILYTWQSSDIATLGEGDFMAWWTFTLPSTAPKDTPEFPIRVGDHGPGYGTQIGIIVMGVAAHMPISLDVLRSDERYGDLWLQQQAEVIKLRVLGTTMSPDAEESLGTVFLDYLSKRLALQLINPAIEYWSRQQQTATATDVHEVVSYPNMITSLQQLGRRLVRELAQEWRDLMAIQPGLAVRHVMPLPATTLGDPTNPCNGYVTKNPRSTQALETGGWGWGLEFGVWPFP